MKVKAKDLQVGDELAPGNQVILHWTDPLGTYVCTEDENGGYVDPEHEFEVYS